MNAKVVPGTIKRDVSTQTIDFQVTDGSHTYPVSYHGLAPDTFTDQQDIEVVVEGRLGRDGVFRATTLLAKCGSRYSGKYAEGRRYRPARPGGWWLARGWLRITRPALCVEG